MIKRLFSTKISPIIVTKNAWDKMVKINEKQKEYSFLFSATSGGCNGFNYNFNLINKDEYYNIYNTHYCKIIPTVIEEYDTKILIDPLSELLLLGTTIDYINEDYSNGIFENKFIFTPNKKLASSCGCGISFLM